jgi:hypothetical protein
MDDRLKTKAGEILERKRASATWIQDNYWEEWAQTLQAYYMNRDPEKDEKDEDDPTQTSVHMPDTFAYVRRTCARVTAQPPNIKFHAKDEAVKEVISRTLMYQWDKARVQRQQKLHVTQALLFGWSVRAWHWAVDEYVRSRRIDPFQQAPEVIDQIDYTYGDQIQKEFGVSFKEMPPKDQPEVIAWLMEKRGKGELLKVSYMQKAYEGPKCDFISIADCYPTPGFESIQSHPFILERRRDKAWMKRTAEWLKAQGYTDEANRLNKVLVDKPNGSKPYDLGSINSDSGNFRSRMGDAAGRTELFNDIYGAQKGAAAWVVTEEHVPGEKPVWRLMCEDDEHYIGEIPHPYDLEGKIPFTDLVFIDNLLGGIGDSTARIMRGLQELHSRNACIRTDLANSLARPYMWTTDEEIYENADKVMPRGKGMRMLLTRDGPQSIGILNEGPAQASMASTLNDESAIQRQIMMMTGDNNMSNNAGVDPQQGKTATGARIMAYNQDVLTKDLNDMFRLSSLEEDANMMFMLNRSELTEPFDFEGSRYNRSYSVDRDPFREEWTKVTPQLFQADGEIIVESGSTLADDDESKQQKAQTMFGIFKGAPNVNQDHLRDYVLISLGEGRNLQQWAQQMPPPEPPPPVVKPSISVSAKLELLTPEERSAVFKAAEIEVAPIPGLAMTPMPPPPDPGGMQAGAGPMPSGAPPPSEPPPPMMPPPIDAGAGAYAAAKGINPLAGGPQ